MITKEVTNTNKKYETLNASQKTAVDNFIAMHRTRGMSENQAITAAATEAKDYAHLAGRHRHTAGDVESDSKLPGAMSEFVNSLRKGS